MRTFLGSSLEALGLADVIHVTARLRVNEEGAAAEIKDSPFCTPVKIYF